MQLSQEGPIAVAKYVCWPIKILNIFINYIINIIVNKDISFIFSYIYLVSQLFTPNINLSSIKFGQININITLWADVHVLRLL